MKKFLTLVLVLTFVFAVSAIAKDAFSFEPNDTLYYKGGGMEPFFTGYRDSKPEDFSIVEGKKWWHGTHALQLTMTHPGNQWILLTKNHYVAPDNPEYMDSTFIKGLTNRDTIYYYLYIPWNAPIDSIFIFVRDENWQHDEHTVYHASDLNFGRWNELKDGISDNLNLSTLRIVQTDFQIDIIADTVPACTLYFDAISSKGRVPPQLCDTAGQSGIEIPEPGDDALSVAKNSINCVEYTINVNTLVMIQVFDLTGRKQVEIPVGLRSAGSYRIPLDLPSGVYLSVVTAGGEVARGKTICVK